MKLKQLFENETIRTVTGTLYFGGKTEENVTVVVDCAGGSPYETGILGCRVVSVEGGPLAQKVLRKGAKADYDTEHGPSVLDAVENAWAVS